MRPGNGLDARPADASTPAADEWQGLILPPVPPAVVAQVRAMITSAALMAEVDIPRRPGWFGFTRIADGLTVSRIGPLGNWVVLPDGRDNRPAIFVCANCEHLMMSPEEAMAVADHSYPPLNRR